MNKAKHIALTWLLSAFLSNTAAGTKSITAQQRQEQKPPEQTETIKISTNLVQVDAIVTDEQGRLVTDLQTSDFEIVENGRVRTIEYCRYFPLSKTRPDAITLTDGRLARNELGRTIVFLVANPIYDLSYSFTNNRTQSVVAGSVTNMSNVSLDANTVSDFLQKFAREQMGQRDLVALHATEYDLGVLARFTNEPATLSAAIEHLRRTASSGARTQLYANNAGLSSGALTEQNLAVLQTLGETVKQVEWLPGRKVVVLISRGLHTDPRLSGSDRVRERLDAVITQANQARISIYTLNPRGLGLRGGGVQDMDGLIRLSEETGGRALYNTNDFTAGFAEILQESEGYYLLGYELGDTPPAAPRKIKVRVKRPGLKAHARASAFANQPADKDPKAAENANLATALNTPLAVRDLHVQLAPLFISPDGKTARIISHLNLALDGLTLTPRADGAQSFKVELAALIIGPDGKVVRQESNTLNSTLSAADFARMRRQGLPLNFTIEAPKPGYYQVNAAVRDLASGRIGNASRWVEVADLKRNNLALSDLFLTVATPESTAPNRTNQTQRFAVTDGLAFQCFVYHARANGADRHSRLEMTVKLKRGGELVFSTLPKLVSQPPDPLVAIGGQLALTGLKPGVYLCELTVVDLEAKNTVRSVSLPIEIY